MKYRKKLCRTLFLLFLFAMVFFRHEGIGSAGDSVSTPKNNPVSTRPVLNPSAPIIHLFDFYKNFISRVDGDRCPMYPSCAAYGKEAFQKHGLFMGWIMTSDRLLRCGRDEVNRAPRVWVNGQKQSYDPLTNNDFWR